MKKKEALDEAHSLGLNVVVWTWPEHGGSAFDPKTVKRMIARGGDGIIADDPGGSISMLAAVGYGVPGGSSRGSAPGRLVAVVFGAVVFPHDGSDSS